MGEKEGGYRHNWVNCFNAEVTFGRGTRTQICLKIIQTLLCSCLLESSCYVLSDEHQYARVSVISFNFASKNFD